MTLLDRLNFPWSSCEWSLSLGWLEIRCNWYYLLFYGTILVLIFGGLLLGYLCSLEDELNDTLDNITETNITDTLTGLGLD